MKIMIFFLSVLFCLRLSEESLKMGSGPIFEECIMDEEEEVSRGATPSGPSLSRLHGEEPVMEVAQRSCSPWARRLCRVSLHSAIDVSRTERDVKTPPR